MNTIILFIGTTEILIIAGVALLLFGGAKLPELMRNMGKGVKGFKEGLQEGSKAFSEEMNNSDNTQAESKDANKTK